MKHKELYSALVGRISSGEIVAPAEIGNLIVVLAHLSGEIVDKIPKAEFVVSMERSKLLEGVDASTAKPMSSAKADALTEALPEYLELREMKATVAVIENYSNALKAMARLVVGEAGGKGGY